MKLLVLSFDYYPDSGVGSFRTMALMEQLLKMQRDDIKIDLITTMHNQEGYFSPETCELEHYGQLRIRRIPIPKHHPGFWGQGWAFFLYARQVRKIVQYEKYKVVYASSSRLMMASLAAWIARRQKAILFLDIRALFVDTLGEVLPKYVARFVKPWFAKLEHWTLAAAQHVNLMSQGFQSYVQQRFSDKKLTYYPHGIDNDFLQGGFQSINHASEQFTILYVGHIGDGQGLECIVPQLAKLLEGCAQIKIMGNGPRKPQLEAAIMLCPNVALLPVAQGDALIQAYTEADLLFLHLHDTHVFRKILPSKLFEYAATGKPILAGVAGYAAEFIQAEITNAMVFQPGHAELACKAISQLDFVVHPREVFIKKYQRDELMQKMAMELIAYFSRPTSPSLRAQRRDPVV
ncbi:MAG: glycosyltransferase family 4 protein [Legionellales bacterium]|nr:glycosyltransferase family 4 protein [Legionellales bacterium]